MPDPHPDPDRVSEAALYAALRRARFDFDRILKVEPIGSSSKAMLIEAIARIDAALAAAHPTTEGAGR